MLFDRMFREFKHDQTSSNTTKHHQTSWPNGKMFDHQTTFDDVWSSNISRLARALKHKFALQKQNKLNKAHTDRMNERNSNEERNLDI